MVIVAQRHETKRLKNPFRRMPHGHQHFCHPVHRASLRVEGDFDKVALFHGLRQPQQTAGYRDGLKFTFCTLPVFRQDDGCHCTAKLNSCRAPGGMGLGKVGHSQNHYGTRRRYRGDY